MSKDAIDRLREAARNEQTVHGLVEVNNTLRQQLAAALAACKRKDAALENVEGMLDELRDYPVTHNEIIEALAIQPDDSTKFLS